MVAFATQTEVCPYTPSRDNVLVREIDDAQLIGNIALPDDCSDVPKRGVVVAVGPGLWNDGAHEPMEYEVGDEILMFGDQPFVRFPVVIDGRRQEYHIIRAVYLRGKLTNRSQGA